MLVQCQSARKKQLHVGGGSNLDDPADGRGIPHETFSFFLTKDPIFFLVCLAAFFNQAVHKRPKLLVHELAGHYGFLTNSLWPASLTCSWVPSRVRFVWSSAAACFNLGAVTGPKQNPL